MPQRKLSGHVPGSPRQTGLMDRASTAWRRAMAATVFFGSALQAVSRSPHAHDYTSQSWQGRRDLLDDALLGVLGVGMVVSPPAYASGRLERFDYALPSSGRRGLATLGFGLIGASAWLFRRSHADLGRNWTPHLQLRAEQDLVTSGVYRRIRHPMYTSQWLFHAAQACLLQNWLTGAAGFASFLPFYLRRVSREEAMMRERFGRSWDVYAARSGRVFPRRSTLR